MFRSHTVSLRHGRGRHKPAIKGSSCVVQNWRISNPRISNPQTGVSRPIIYRLASNLVCSFMLTIRGLLKLWSKIALVENLRWRRPPSCSWFFGHISVATEHIFVKFGRPINIAPLWGLLWPKIQLSVKFKTAPAPILKTHKHDYIRLASSGTELFRYVIISF